MIYEGNTQNLDDQKRVADYYSDNVYISPRERIWLITFNTCETNNFSSKMDSVFTPAMMNSCTANDTP